MTPGTETEEELDLTREPASRQVRDALRVPTEAYNPERHREWIRAGLAAALIVLLAVIMAGMIAGLLLGTLKVADLGPIAAVLVSPIVGLLGAALGFYFGDRPRQN